MSLLAALRQPYPFPELSRSFWRGVFYSGFILLFLLVFKPFGLQKYSYEKSYLILGYSVVTFLTLISADYLAFHLFPATFTESAWKVYNQLVYITYHSILAGVANFCYAALIHAFPWTVAAFLTIQGYVLLCTILPLIMVTLIRQNYMLKRNIREARSLETELTESAREVIAEASQEVISGVASEPVPEEPMIQLPSDTQSPELRLPADALYYLAAMDNYVEAVYLEKGVPRKQLLRSTLSRIEEILKPYPMFFRCHRSFIVNTKKITRIEGNAQGYVLTLLDIATPIPVSRSRGQELHRRHSSQNTPIRP